MGIPHLIEAWLVIELRARTASLPRRNRRGLIDLAGAARHRSLSRRSYLCSPAWRIAHASSSGKQPDMTRITTSRKTARTKPDLRPTRRMRAAEIDAAVRSDPDAKPFSAAELARMKHTPRARFIRRALGLTQEEVCCPLSDSSRHAEGLGAGRCRARSGRARLSQGYCPRSRSRAPPAVVDLILVRSGTFDQRWSTR